MNQLEMRFASLLVLILSLSSCANLKISDTPLIIREPAKRTCFEVKVLSWQEKVYSKEECDKLIEKSIILTYPAWKMLKNDIESNCQNKKCKQLTGAADGLFIAIDEALQHVP